LALLPEVASSDPCSSCDILAERFTQWLTIAGLATRLRDLPNWPAESSTRPATLDAHAEMATKQWTGGFNPRPAAREDYLAMYQAAV
jgi:alcohol dehydrogenase class IV